MKKKILTAMMLSLALCFGAQAGENHKHGSKKEKQSASDKKHTCEKCKKSEKDCKCDEKHDDHTHSANENEEKK